MQEAGSDSRWVGRILILVFRNPALPMLTFRRLVLIEDGTWVLRQNGVIWVEPHALMVKPLV